MKANNIIELPSNQPVLLDNITCPYCGKELNEDNNNKEHVIGRRFVPKGSLNENWNLIVKACKKCNSYKADLENDISAITLSTALYPCSNIIDETTKKEALRKAKNSISERTGKSVLNSKEELKIDTLIAPNIFCKIGMTSPPQINSERIFYISSNAYNGIFYFITFNQGSKRGGFWPEDFYPLPEAQNKNWGNSLHKAFMKKVVDWEPRWIIDTANGFKSICRRHPNADCWSWAIEWNKNYRIIGFFGSKDASTKILNNFQKPMMTTIAKDGNTHIKIRKEVSLSEEDDLLFKWDK